MSKVYFVKKEELFKLKDILPDFSGKLAVKTHFGEEGNTAYIKAPIIREICSWVDKPVLIETSVLYKSPRREAATHRELALRHGFDFAPIEILDGEQGDDAAEVEINAKHISKAYIAAGLGKFDSLLVVSHFKGHSGASFGGALKNLGMGLSARRGKLAQHASIQHTVREYKCVGCGDCISNCPAEAIFLADGVARINQDACISCSKCIAVCPIEAIRIPWGSTGTETLQERIAEYASAAVKGKKCFYLNFLTDMTPDCDCQGKDMPVLLDDIGILASSDPVAIDQAAFDLVWTKKPLTEIDGNPQLRRGEEIGLGSRQYELINL